MKKTTKIAIMALVVLIIATIPIYMYIRQTTGSEEFIQVKGEVQNPMNMTLSYLKSLSSATVEVSLKSSNPANNGNFSFKGVPVQTIIEQANCIGTPTAVYLQAADGYGVTIPIGDILQNNQAIIAYERDGELLGAISEGGDGPFRLIIGTDEFAQRWIRGVSIIEVQ